MLKLGKSAPFEDEIEKATNENNLTEDWSLIMQICDNAINYQDGAKFCLKSIMKRLHHNVPRVVLQTLVLLDACVKNCDRRFLLQVASSEFTTEVRKLLGKMNPSVAEKLKALIQKWSLEEFKDDPELCIIPALYYKLKSEGVEFPSVEKEKKSAVPICTDPDAVTSQEEENDIIKALEISLKDTGRYHVPAEYGSSSLGSESTTKVLPEPFKVRALYDFEAAEDNELTIKTGEIVLILDNSNANWWKGSNHRGEGLLPANFVTEDLEVKPEEIIVEKISNDETIPDTTFTGEIKLDEVKIETVINWLNETDPAGDLSDPEEMLRLEDEVYKMGPLIEENLQSIDKRLAMLNLVNEKIMAAFDLFHSLSDNWSTLPPNMKYCAERYAFGTMPITQTQIPPTSAGTIQPIPSQPMMYVPAPASSSQYSMASDQTNCQPVSTIQSQVPKQSQEPIPGTASQDLPTESTSSNKNISVTNSVPTSSASQMGQPPVMMSPYNANTMGGFYMPPPVPFPFQYPPNQSNMPAQGYVQTPGAIQNFVNFPYPVPPMGPYVPFPYYYMNSNATSAQMDAFPLTSAQNANQGVKIPSTTAAAATVENTTSISTFPTYSNDLQSMSYNNSSSNCDENVKQELSSDSSIKAAGDSSPPTEPVHVSKQT